MAALEEACARLRPAGLEYHSGSVASTKHTLLVVDDEASARYSLRRVFESEDTVIEAESGLR